MGKKSRRRTGRGKGNASGGGAASVLDAAIDDGADPSAAGAGLGTERDTLPSNVETEEAVTERVDTAAALARILKGITPRESLKGIVNTNADPLQCASKDCSRKLDFWSIGTNKLMRCCGKQFCAECNPLPVDLLGNVRCSGCRGSQLWKLFTAERVERSHSGENWAQYVLGHTFLRTDDSSSADGVKWLQRAAIRGHPPALLRLSHEHAMGRNLPRSLSCAQILAWKAVELWGDSDWRRQCFVYLICFAEELAADGSDEGLDEAGAILRDIAKDAEKVDLNAEYCFRAAEILERIESVDSRSACARFASRLFSLGHP